MNYLQLTPEQEAAIAARQDPPVPDVQLTPEQAERMTVFEAEREALMLQAPEPSPTPTPTNTMPLAPIEVTPEARAHQIANQFVVATATLAKQISEGRANGIPAVPAVPSSVAPNGQVIPARPALPAVSAELLDAAMGTANCAMFDALKPLVLGTP